MKKRFYKYLLIPCALLIGLAGCTKEYYTIEEKTEVHYDGASAKNVPFVVGDEKNPWEWNENNARYERFFKLDELTQDVYNYGTMIGNVFVDAGLSSEWLEMLPYQAVYYYTDDDENQIPYSVLISCAFTPGEVGFFLQLSDRMRDDNILDIYEFKVTLLWDADKNLPKN